MKIVVVTGSTRGIGYGLAQAFLERDCKVVVSTRTQSSVEQAVETLGAKFGRERVIGQMCEVTDYQQVKALWDAAKSHYGRVDLWVNNAAIGSPQHWVTAGIDVGTSAGNPVCRRQHQPDRCDVLLQGRHRGHDVSGWRRAHLQHGRAWQPG